MGHAVAKTHEESAALEHREVLGSALDCGRDNHDNTTGDDGYFATKAVSNEGAINSVSVSRPRMLSFSYLHNRQTGNGSNTVKSGQKTKIGALRIVEIVGPLRQDTNVVQHRSIGKTVNIFSSVVAGRNSSSRLTHRSRWLLKQRK